MNFRELFDMFTYSLSSVQPCPFQSKFTTSRLFQHFGPESLPPDPDFSLFPDRVWEGFGDSKSRGGLFRIPHRKESTASAPGVGAWMSMDGLLVELIHARPEEGVAR